MLPGEEAYLIDTCRSFLGFAEQKATHALPLPVGCHRKPAEFRNGARATQAHRADEVTLLPDA